MIDTINNNTVKFTSIAELNEYLKQNYLSGLDSELSPYLLKLKKQFDADDIHINSWWVLTSRDWKCPVCNRSKSDIVKINKHNHLSGHLHEHHDHMKDLVEKKFNEISSSRHEVIADKLSEKFIQRLSFGFSAFDNTIICVDCNNADKEAKKIIKSHKDFSFAPSDISLFINISNNKEHEIDIKMAQKVWNDQKDIFYERMKLIESICTLASYNNHWYKPSQTTALQIERIGQHFIKLYNLHNLNVYPPISTLYMTNKYATKNDNWRVNKKITTTIPTAGEIQHLININGSTWNSLDEMWQCPVCSRSKQECIQKSKKGNLFFKTWHKDFFNHTKINWCEAIKNVCNECHDTFINLHKEIDKQSELSSSSKFVSYEELKAIIIVKANTPHKINNKNVEQLLPTLIKRFENDIYTFSHLSPQE